MVAKKEFLLHQKCAVAIAYTGGFSSNLGTSTHTRLCSTGLVSGGIYDEVYNTAVVLVIMRNFKHRLIRVEDVSSGLVW